MTDPDVPQSGDYPESPVSAPQPGGTPTQPTEADYIPISAAPSAPVVTTTQQFSVLVTLNMATNPSGPAIPVPVEAYRVGTGGSLQLLGPEFFLVNSHVAAVQPGMISGSADFRLNSDRAPGNVIFRAVLNGVSRYCSVAVVATPA